MSCPVCGLEPGECCQSWLNLQPYLPASERHLEAWRWRARRAYRRGEDFTELMPLTEGDREWLRIKARLETLQQEAA